MPKPTPRPLWRRVLAHPLVSFELSFVLVVVALACFAVSPIGQGISHAIATHENVTLVAALIVGVTLIVGAALVGLGAIALQVLARSTRRSS